MRRFENRSERGSHKEINMCILKVDKRGDAVIVDWGSIPLCLSTQRRKEDFSLITKIKYISRQSV